MALIICPECGKEFSSYADTCPKCGLPTDDALQIIYDRTKKTEFYQPTGSVAYNEEEDDEELSFFEKYCTTKNIIIATIIALVIGVTYWNLSNKAEMQPNDTELVIAKNWRFGGHILRNGENQPVKISFYQDGTEFRNCKFQDIKKKEIVDMEVAKEGETFFFEGMNDGKKYLIEVEKNANGTSWMGTFQCASKTMDITLFEEDGI